MALAGALARRRLYYGWYIVAVAFVAGFVVAALNGDAPGIFMKPMTQELHWSRGFFSMAVYGSQLLSVPLSMLLWPLVDRRGARGVMVVSGVIFGVGTAALGLVREPWHFLLIKSLIIPFGVAGAGPVISTLVVSSWFIKKRGRALAISAMGPPAAGIVMPLLVAFLISALGWRQAWMVLSLMPLTLGVVPMALLMRRRPEDLGLLPDGEPAAVQEASSEAPSLQSEVQWSRREVLHTPTFWLLAFAFPLGILGWGVIKQHLYPYLTDPAMGLTSQMAALVLTILSVFSFAFKLPWGFISERVSPRYCATVSFLLFGAGFALVLLAGSNLMALFLAASFMALGFSPSNQFQGLIWANYYGRRSQGLARSLATPPQALSGLLGSVLAGFVWDVTGTYKGIFYAYATSPVLTAFLVWLARPPKKSTPSLIR